jgi:hypothetical protein
MTSLPTTLFDRRSGQIIPATIRFGLTATEILAVETVWGPWRRAAVERLVTDGFPEDQMPQHWHWDWGEKVPQLDMPVYRAVGVDCAGETQGLMMITTAGHMALLAPEVGKPVVYVSYLESAPWNVPLLANDPRFGSVGKRLIWAAVRASVDEGFHGRVGLHSLPQAEAFYAQGCGMELVGIDPDYESLAYFELTREAAATILAEGQGA